jgi:hypothetical protein
MSPLGKVNMQDVLSKEESIQEVVSGLPHIILEDDEELVVVNYRLQKKKKQAISKLKTKFRATLSQSPTKKVTDLDPEEVYWHLADPKEIEVDPEKPTFTPSVMVKNSIIRPLRNIEREKYIEKLNFGKATTIKPPLLNQKTFVKAIDGSECPSCEESEVSTMRQHDNYQDTRAGAMDNYFRCLEVWLGKNELTLDEFLNKDFFAEGKQKKDLKDDQTMTQHQVIKGILTFHQELPQTISVSQSQEASIDWSEAPLALTQDSVRSWQTTLHDLEGPPTAYDHLRSKVVHRDQSLAFDRKLR